MAKRRIILHLGLVQSGEEALAAGMRAHPGVSYAAPGAGLARLLDRDPRPEAWLARFGPDPAPVLFESWPACAHGGALACIDAIARLTRLLERHARLTVLVTLGNLVERAFLHYWHEIAAHHALYGNQWAVTDTADPARFDPPYRRSFVQQLDQGLTTPKFTPEIGPILARAITVLGPDRLRLAHAPDLGAAAAALLREQGVEGAPELPRTLLPVAPLYLEGGRDWAFAGRDGRELLHVPAGHCLLVSRGRQELLSAARHDLGAITGAARLWSRQVVEAELPDYLDGYLQRQHQALAALPARCFLAQGRDALLADVLRRPERLKIGQPRRSAAQARRILAAAEVQG